MPDLGRSKRKMLNLDDPQSRHIFQAVKLEDSIRPILVAAERDNRNLSEEEKVSAFRSLDQLLEIIGKETD